MVDSAKGSAKVKQGSQDYFSTVNTAKWQGMPGWFCPGVSGCVSGWAKVFSMTDAGTSSLGPAQEWLCVVVLVFSGLLLSR